VEAGVWGRCRTARRRRLRAFDPRDRRDASRRSRARGVRGPSIEAGPDKGSDLGGATLADQTSTAYTPSYVFFSLCPIANGGRARKDGALLWWAQGELHRGRRLAAAAARTLPARRQPWSSRWEIKTRTTSGKTRVATVSKAVRPKVIARKSEAMKPRRTSRANPIRVGMRREANDVSSRASRSAAGSKATGTAARPPAEHPAGRAPDPATRIRRTDNANCTPRRRPPPGPDGSNAIGSFGPVAGGLENRPAETTLAF